VIGRRWLISRPCAARDNLSKFSHICASIMSKFYYLYLSQNLLKTWFWAGFEQVCGLSAISYRQVGDKKSEHVTGLLNLSLRGCYGGATNNSWVGNIPTSLIFFPAHNLSRLVSDRTEVMEFGLYAAVPRGITSYCKSLYECLYLEL